ncbi:MAG: PEGA domain-containing protein, partial [Tyzzerella sp.]|nr:PEGA domain-containing protein [Tyzzerella sp.]
MEKPSKLTTKKLIIIIAAVVAVCGLVLGALVFSRNNIKEVASEDDYGYVNPDETKAETDAGFVIDGVLDEEQYQKNNWLYLSNKEGGADVEIAMTSYYGEKGMYFVYDVTEGNPIYVNTARASYLNSCIEMYLAPSTVTSLSGNSLFEIDLLPTGDMTFKKSNGKGGYVNVATTDDKMAVLGATTKGGEVNSEECYGYCLELFIPWDYMDKFDLDSDAMKDSFVYVDPAHITSFNFAGTDTNVDRYWYYFAQQHGAGFSDVYQYFRFDEKGVQGSVPVELQAGEHYTIEGTKAVIPGMKTNITITPEAGYTLHSILINGEEYIKKANFNEDGSVTLNVRGVKEGLKISATAVIATEGNKTLSGTVIANKLGGGSLKDVSASYTGPTGEKPLELDSNGKFTLTDLKQGYYTITIEKEGYEKLVRSIYLNRDMEVELSLEYQTFAVTKGSCWILDDQNNGVLHKFGGSGNLLSNDKYDKFTVEANFKYDTDLPNEADTDAFTQQRQGLRIVFSNEKAWHIDVMNENGKYIVQYAKHSGDNSVFGWKGIHEMTEAEVAKFTSEDGIKLEVQRDGKYANVYLDGKLIAVEVLDDEYVKLSAQIGFEFWVANREIMDVPYKITTANSVNLKSTLFKTAKGWDVSGQYNGLLTMPEGGRGDLKFVNKYANMDLTLRVKDYDDAEKKAARTDVLFVFDNGAHISFGITSDDKGAWIQSLNQSADKVDGKATQFIYKRYKSWGALSEEEFAQYKDGGVDFRIVRYGTEVTLYIGDRMVAVADLTSNNSGVTADMPATVTIRHYDDAGVKVEMPFELTQEFNLVKITTIAGKNGSVTTEKQQYFVGDTVKVLAGKDDYYCTWMKVNGKEVDINWDYTYSFTATEKEYTVEGDLAKKVFAASKEWNLLQQNAGKLIVPNSDGDSGWVNTVEKTYKDVDLKFTLKDTKSEDKNFRTGVRLTFTNDEYVTFSVTNDTKDGSYILQNMGGSILNWKNPGYTLNAEQTAGITGDGLEMRIVRIGSGVDIYLGGEHAYGFDLSTNVDGEDSEVEDKAAQIAVRHYGNTGVDAEIGFEFAEAEKPVKITIEDSKNGTAVTKQMHYFEGQTVIASGKGEEGYYCSGLEVDGKDVELNWDGTYSFTAEKEGHTIKGSFSESVFKDNSGWDLVEQNAGLIGLPENRTGNSSWLELYDQYGDIDLTLTARDYIGDGTDACTVVRFVIDGKEASFRIGHMDGTYKVQTYGNSSLYKWSYSFNLTNEEIKEYQSEAGLDFRVVRKGTDIYLYAGDRRVCNVFDLTYDKDSVETGITADMPASIFIKQDGNLGHEVEIEYVIKTEVPDEAKITIADGIANGTITTEFSKYLAGDKVGLVTTGADGYYYDSLKANDKDVKVDENTLLPTFTAKTENTVTGSFAPAVFKNGGGGKWNLVNHNVGILALANSNGDSSWLDSCDSTYRGVSVNVQDKIGNTKQFRMQIYFAFDNGETFRIRLHDTDKDGKYRIQTMEDSITPTWKPYYELSDDEVDKLQGEDGINLRVEIVGVIANIYLDDVNVCQISLMKDRDGKDTGVGSEAASVTLRLYGNTGYNTLVPYALMKAKEAKVNLTSESTDGGSIEVVTQNNYVNGYVTVKPVAKDGYGCTGLKVNGNNAILEADGTYTFLATEENTVEATFKRKVILNINVPTDAAYGTITPKADYYVGDNVELAVDTADGYNCKDFVVKQGGKEVLSEKVIFKDGTYSFKAEKYNYTVEGSFVEKIFNEKTNNAYNDWDLTGQYEGVMTHNVSSSNSSWLVFNKQYVNSDITLTVIEHDETGNDSNSNASRTSVQYSIGDKYWTSFSVFHWNNTYQIAGRTNDSLNQGDANKSGVVYYSLSKDEIALLKSKEGIEFRVIRNGTLVDIYLDGRLVVEDIDLTGDGAYSNVITATTPTDVKIKRDDDKNIQTVIPFTISEALPETVTLNIPTTIDNGTITKGKDSYIVGEKVTLTVAGNNNTYYYDSLTVNDKEVMVENDGTYTFTATEKVYDINGSFAQTIFSIDDTEQPLKYWNLTNQHKGVIVQRDDYTGVTNVYANFAGTHTNSDVTLII